MRARKKNQWDLLALVILSYGLYEFSNKIIYLLESSGAYDSLEYILMISLMTVSMCLAVYAMLSLWKTAECNARKI